MAVHGLPLLDCGLRGQFSVPLCDGTSPISPRPLRLDLPGLETSYPSSAPPALQTEEFSEAWREWVEARIVLDDHAKQLQPSHERLFTRTKYLIIFHMGLLGWMASLPESITKWEPGTFSSKQLPEQWVENVKEGPVRDKDLAVINYLFHPYQGAAYYNIARQEGLDGWGAFWYSFLLSTFLWEYGFEAFAEPPSIQDLIVTPTVGALLGEAFFRLNRRIQNGGGAVLGSQFLGRFCRFFLNPLGRIVRWVQRDTHLLFGQGLELSLVRRLRILPLHQQGNPFADVEAGAEAENVSVLSFSLRF